VRRHGSSGTAPRIATIIAWYLALFLAYQTIGKAFLDPLKNLHELTSAIAATDPSDTPVYAYRPNESLSAIVNFDLGRTVTPLETTEELSSLFAREPNARVVMSVEIARGLPPEMTGRLQFVYDETGRKASPFAIVEWRP
jgi:hypothetical protein